jgi:phenylalanyl-tRNA synthetase beta chain
MLDVDLDAVFALGPREVRYAPLRKFPSSRFDLSVVTNVYELVGDIQRKLRELRIETVIAVEFVRQYAGPPLPEGSKSVSFRVTVGAADRTLSSEEIGEVRTRLIEGMRDFGYDLRV